MIGENIRKIRKEKRISINRLAQATQISLGYLSDLENGKANNPSLEKLNRIADELNVPVNIFFDENIRESWNNSNTKGPDYIDDEGNVYEFKQFKSPEAAMQFILSQPTIMAYGGFDINKLSDQDKIDFANDLLSQLKLLGLKYNK
ncbi:helix-turn-helix domain-containing protein [Clostridium butyricum]